MQEQEHKEHGQDGGRAIPTLAYTEREACEIVRMNRDALRYYRELGWLRFIPGGRGGSKILYRLEHLTELLDRIEREAADRATLPRVPGL